MKASLFTLVPYMGPSSQSIWPPLCKLARSVEGFGVFLSHMDIPIMWEAQLLYVSNWEYPSSLIASGACPLLTKRCPMARPLRRETMG